jgi:tRNA 5-methylaminomethyl-2-thiouridine biosynthesis bifunctional protein
VQLTLLIGDATECFSQINDKMDAWFLDGFAPAKNPDMWQVELFQQMKRLSKPNTTFATFTSAGDVRRGLINAGFEVKKRVGYGKKREMLTGHFIGTDNEA